MTTIVQRITDEAAARLREVCPPGTAVYVTDERTRGGSFLRLYVARRGDIVDITHHAALVTRRPVRERAGHRTWAYCGGKGVDHGDSMVQSLATVLHRDARALAKRNL